jgi:hypothetical protein
MEDDLKKIIQQKTIKIKAKNAKNQPNNPKQLKTTFVGVVLLLSVRKNHHQHHITNTTTRV